MTDLATQLEEKYDYLVEVKAGGNDSVKAIPRKLVGVEVKVLSVVSSACWLLVLPAAVLAFAPGEEHHKIFWKGSKIKTIMKGLSEAMTGLEDQLTLITSALTSDASPSINDKVSDSLSSKS